MNKSMTRGRRPSSQRKTARKGSLLSRRQAAKASPPVTRKKSRPEDELNELLRSRGYRDFEMEHHFAKEQGRKWRLDFAWVSQKVALEIEGGVWMRGRHVRPAGFIADCEKYNAATLNGWRVYRIPVVKGWHDAAMLYVQTEKLT